MHKDLSWKQNEIFKNICLRQAIAKQCAQSQNEHTNILFIQGEVAIYLLEGPVRTKI